MKNLLSFIFLSGFFVSCNGWFTGHGEPFPPEPDIIHYKTIQNNSSHMIEVIRVFEGENYPYTLYPTNEKVFFNQISEWHLPFFPTLGDSAYVVYDDTISVLHTKQEEQKVSRSIMLESSYTGGKVNDTLYKIYYEFTDAYYEEAVKINEGG